MIIEKNQQTRWIGADGFAPLDVYLSEKKIKSIFLVHGKSMENLPIGRYFNELTIKSDIQVKRFTDFHPNPDDVSVAKGIRLFREHPCDMIAAVGGGSAMDVAKTIKLFGGHEPERDWLQKLDALYDVPLLVSPTTAGTGSEATRYAVIYAGGEKQSIADESCIPSVVIFDARSLEGLPPYQRKSAMLDALCHAIESFWSINATEESRELSAAALQEIMEHKDGHLSNEAEGNEGMMKAAFLAGKAINITETTAGHAMCYKLTSLYGISHGHAAALCVSVLWPYMIRHLEDCVDSRGASYLRETMDRIARIMGGSSIEDGARIFHGILDAWGIGVPTGFNNKDIGQLAGAVNAKRLKNHPVRLEYMALEELYLELLERR